MRYRRYYTHHNRDGSRTVIRTGPFVGAAKATAGTKFFGWLVFVFCFTLITPFPAYSLATTWWAVIMGSAATIVHHTVGNGRKKRR